MSFNNELQSLINRHSLENNSDTPDYILAQYVLDCLEAYARATSKRDSWYGSKTPTWYRSEEQAPR